MHVVGTTMPTKPRLFSLLASLLVLSVSGCGGDDPLDVDSTDVVGSWNITSLIYAAVTGGASVEALEPGVSGVVTFRSDLTYSIVFEEVGPPMVTDIEDGTFTVTADVIRITPDDAPGDPSDLEIVSLTATTLTLFQADDEFDFDDGGIDEPATTTVVLQKQ